ncbi:C5a anaphylatoxin chemotactic receptor 1 isoform X3 [Lynx rufus]|uniref:C5a anaphylatoxin chemotactic receptor 1 isoform X3 n=1 Tax=Lynx rufus TaxID=61384 RepID=UPI001F124962|nr:C5a anaphylatoxin chemotactic receptor 1 isoform X3 [Lynx rufus]
MGRTIRRSSGTRTYVTGSLRELNDTRKALTCMDSLNYSTPDYADYGWTVDPYMPVDKSSRTPALSAPNVTALVILAVVFLVGVPGNSLVVWVTGFEVRRNINAIWFLNLAVADLLSCLALPILFTSIVQHGHWPYGEVACRVLPSLILLNMYASILLLATISADRFLLVFNPVWCQNYRGARLAWAACGVAWGLALLLTIPSFMYRAVRVEAFPIKMECGVSYGKDRFVTERVVAILRLVVTGMMLALSDPRSRIFKSVSALDALCVAFAYVNCCINPVIYVAAARGFHARFLKSLPARLRNVLTEESVSRDSKSYTLSTADTPAQKSQAV